MCIERNSVAFPISSAHHFAKILDPASVPSHRSNLRRKRDNGNMSQKQLIKHDGEYRIHRLLLELSLS